MLGQVWLNAELLVSRLRRQEGQALVEYALILGLVSVVAIVVLAALGVDVKDIIDNVEDKIDSTSDA